MDALPGGERVELDGPRERLPEPPGRSVARAAGPEEAALVSANKLQLVERLADDLAHEIKNPLHSMVINLEVLRRRIGRPERSEPEELTRYTDVLGSELDRVNRRIDLLLRLVRPDRGAEPTTLKDTVEEILDVVEVERARRGITITFDPAPVAVRASLAPDVARQLVLNILFSAIDALDRDGALELRTEARPGSFSLHASTSAAERAIDTTDERISVARMMARSLGGSLEALPDSLILTLPLPPPPPR